MDPLVYLATEGIAVGIASFCCGRFANCSKKDADSAKFAGGLLMAGGALTFLIGVYNSQDLWNFGGKTPFEIGNGQMRYFRPDATEITLRQCTNLTDSHLAQLKQFPNLSTLRIENASQVTARGLNSLTECPKLERLFVQNGQVRLEEISKSLTEHLLQNQIQRLHAGLPYNREVMRFIKCPGLFPRCIPGHQIETQRLAGIKQ